MSELHLNLVPDYVANPQHVAAAIHVLEYFRNLEGMEDYGEDIRYVLRKSQEVLDHQLYLLANLNNQKGKN